MSNNTLSTAPVGEVAQMPGTGFTMACFHENQVPVGTKLYIIPQQGDTRITELEAALKAMENQRNDLLQALKQIAAIENQEFGADWEEIEQAREIADAAIEKVEGEVN